MTFATRARNADAKRVVDPIEHDDAAARCAALAGIDERRRHRQLRRQIEIRIVTDDERVLAAELEADLREHVAAR